MKKILTTGLFLCFATIIVFGQTLLTSQYLGSRSKAQLTGDVPFLAFKNGIKFYKITYETPNVQGVTSIASGLLIVPDDTTKLYPMLCYQHGTSASKNDVPSAQNAESQIPKILAGMGYVTIAPDYLGLGVSPGFHPYVHAQTEASVGLDGLRAARDFSSDNSLHLNQQVFLTGYSQGGHASMALHQSLQFDHADEFQVTAAAHMSGPYNISGVMRDLLLSGQPYSNPAYLVNTLFSYQFVYGNLYNDIADAVKPAYIPMTEEFFAGTISLGELNDFLLTELTATEGAAIPDRIFNDSYIADIVADPNHPVNVAMQANDNFDWNATAPTRLFYCTADEQVPFMNSTTAKTAMIAAGSTNVDANDVASASTHVACATPALFNTILFFQGYQSVTDLPVLAVYDRELPFDIFPNPASDAVFVKNFPSNGELKIVDLQGKLHLQQPIAEGDNEIQVLGLNDGLYFLDFQGNGGSFRTKLMVRH